MPAFADAVAGWFREQAAGCEGLGSPFYAALLERLAGDIEVGGPAAGVVAPFTDENGGSALALRLMGALHRLVLSGEAPALAARYPSAGGDGDAAWAWPGFRALLAARATEIQARMRSGCQTNEVGRSAALVGGFLEASRRTGLPLRILELGASAGLNLRWDSYRYGAGGAAWGDRASPVRFDHSFVEPPPLNIPAPVAERRGCDLNPIDPTSDEGSLTLRSFIWADQLDRMRRLEAAISVARRVPAEVERTDAVDFLRRQLSAPRPDVATVVVHSVFLQYLDGAARDSIAELVEKSRAMRLSMEPGPQPWVFEVRLDGDLLGTCRAHGTAIRWS